MIIAHIINPVIVKENNPSYLYYTQPITFESMLQAKINTETKFKNTEINLYTINYPEDDQIMIYILKYPKKNYLFYKIYLILYLKILMLIIIYILILILFYIKIFIILL